MNNSTNIQPDTLYERAKTILRAQPNIGKKPLAMMLGVKTPTSRRLRERYWGETKGHSSDPEYLRVLHEKQRHPDWGAGKISEALAITVDRAQLQLARWTGVQTYLAAASVPQSQPPAPPMPAQNYDGTDQLDDSICGDARDIAYRGARIQTIEDLLLTAKIDPLAWRLARHSLSISERMVKNPVTGDFELQKTISIRATFNRRVAEQNFQGILTSMLEGFRTVIPLQPPFVHSAKSRGLLEFSLPDIHVGKLSRSAETGGREYNADIADKMADTAVEDLLQKASITTPERILLVAGNDLLNVDGRDGETSNGCRQDEHLRWQESFVRGKQLLVRAILSLSKVAPVKVLMIQGNHDQERLYYVGQVLSATFENNPHILVDASPRLRKYESYGATLFGYCHGNDIAHQELPIVMALEQPEAWSRARHRTWGLGHFHAKKTKVYLPKSPLVTYEDLHSVIIRILPSLCPPDAWHASRGYISKLAAEAYFWDPEEGCTMTFTHSPT